MTPAPMLVVVSIDTEEDNWHAAREHITVENIRALPALHRRFERIGIRPTYFTSYRVATVGWAAGIVASLASGGAAEVGAHLHPWNTPPLSDAFAPHNTMMKNLAPSLQLTKLGVLTETLASKIGERPTSFRAGRYGIGNAGILALARCGYTVDSSVTPFLDWRRYDNGADFRLAPADAYRPSLRDMMRHDDDSPIIELPLSVGYTRRPFSVWHRRHERLARARVGPISLAGLAYRTGLLRKVQLSPETASVADMLVLARRLIEGGARYLHVSWHSPSLVPGLSPFVATAHARDAFLASIEELFGRLAALTPISFATVSEAARRLVPARVAEHWHVCSG